MSEEPKNEKPQERMVALQVLPEIANLASPASFANAFYVALDPGHATIFFMQTPTMLPGLPGLPEFIGALNEAIRTGGPIPQVTFRVPVVAKLVVNMDGLIRLRDQLDEVIQKKRRSETPTEGSDDQGTNGGANESELTE